MGERIAVGAIAYAMTDAMGSVSLAIEGAVALRHAETRLARARQSLAAARQVERRADARLARLDLLDMLGL